MVAYLYLPRSGARGCNKFPLCSGMSREKFYINEKTKGKQMPFSKNFLSSECNCRIWEIVIFLLLICKFYSRCLAGRMAMHACQIGPTDTAPPCPGSPLRACVGTSLRRCSYHKCPWIRITRITYWNWSLWIDVFNYVSYNFYYIAELCSVLISLFCRWEICQVGARLAPWADSAVCLGVLGY